MNGGKHDFLFGRIRCHHLFDNTAALDHENTIGHGHDFRQVGGNDDDAHCLPAILVLILLIFWRDAIDVVLVLVFIGLCGVTKMTPPE